MDITEKKPPVFEPKGGFLNLEPEDDPDLAKLVAERFIKEILFDVIYNKRITGLTRYYAIRAIRLGVGGRWLKAIRGARFDSRYGICSTKEINHVFGMIAQDLFGWGLKKNPWYSALKKRFKGGK